MVVKSNTAKLNTVIRLHFATKDSLLRSAKVDDAVQLAWEMMS